MHATAYAIALWLPGFTQRGQDGLATQGRDAPPRGSARAYLFVFYRFFGLPLGLAAGEGRVGSSVVAAGVWDLS